MLFNKYLDGYPYLCRTLELSPAGMLAEAFLEPDTDVESFPLELQLGEDDARLWVWARRVWTDGKHHALEFLGMDGEDRARLDRFLFAPG